MSARRALATGEVVRTPDSLCGTPYGLARNFVDPSLGDVTLIDEWRADDDEHLDGLLIKGSQFRTQKGIHVGSTIDQLQAAYPSQLRMATVDSVIDGMYSTPALYGHRTVLIFNVGSNGVIRTMSVLRGRLGNVVKSVFVGC